MTVEVRRTSGERIDNCIYPSSNTEGLSTWKTVAAGRGDPWQQTIRLLLAPQDVFQSHLVFHIEDKPYPPFAIAYMPLWEQQAFLKDGPHALFLYKIDEHTATPQAPAQGKGGYLTLPYTSRDRDGRAAEVTGPLALLRVNTYLCSTRFSQDRVILGLPEVEGLSPRAGPRPPEAAHLRRGDRGRQAAERRPGRSVWDTRRVLGQ